MLLRVTDKKIVELMITELKMYFLGAKEMEQQKLTRVVFVTKPFSRRRRRSQRPTFPNANKYLELTGDLADGRIVRDSNYHQEF